MKIDKEPHFEVNLGKWVSNQTTTYNAEKMSQGRRELWSELMEQIQKKDCGAFREEAGASRGENQSGRNEEIRIGGAQGDADAVTGCTGGHQISLHDVTKDVHILDVKNLGDFQLVGSEDKVMRLQCNAKDFAVERAKLAMRLAQKSENNHRNFQSDDNRWISIMAVVFFFLKTKGCLPAQRGGHDYCKLLSFRVTKP